MSAMTASDASPVSVRSEPQGPLLLIEVAGAQHPDVAAGALHAAIASHWVSVAHDSSIGAVVVTLVPQAHPDATYAPLPLDADGAPPEAPVLPLDLDIPVIAAIEGECAGAAFELALGCDLRIAGSSARFALPPEQGPYRVAPVLLPRLTTAGLGLELLLTARTITAAEARRSRIVSDVVADGTATATAIELARSLASGTSRALRKREVWRYSGLSLPHALDLAARELAATDG